ncbi:MAG: hypothetical protein J5701_03635 [Bacteroidales bacterium]|nr:hypothetical protein [Bacteroidales bacterium]
MTAEAALELSKPQQRGYFSIRKDIEKILNKTDLQEKKLPFRPAAEISVDGN